MIHDLSKELLFEALDDIVAIDKACFGEKHWQEPNFLLPKNDKWVLSKVFKQDDKIVGFVMAYRSTATKAQISRVAVLPEYQRSKIGSALIAEVLKLVDYATVESEASKKNASFFTKCGLTKMSYFELQEYVTRMNKKMPKDYFGAKPQELVFVYKS